MFKQTDTEHLVLLIATFSIFDSIIADGFNAILYQSNVPFFRLVMYLLRKTLKDILLRAISANRCIVPNFHSCHGFALTGITE